MNVLYVVEVCSTEAQYASTPTFDTTRRRVTHFVARQTLQPTPVLPLEEVHDKTIVPHAVQLPLLLARQLRRELLQLRFSLRRHLDVRLLQHTIEVLVQAIEKHAKKLLRIVLFGAGKLFGVGADGAL